MQGLFSVRGVVMIPVTIGAILFAAPAAADHDFAAGVSQGTINSPDIAEASGIVGGRTNPRILWTHNDSGDSARIFAIDDQAQVLGEYALVGAGKIDFEDIAIGPGPLPGNHYLYIGDIGDNNAVRPHIIVHRVPEPAVYVRQSSAPVARDLKGTRSINLTYPDGARDAETMMLDPITGDLFIATKQFNTTRVYRAAAADLNAGGEVALEFVRSISIGNLQTATAGGISRTGSEIIIKGYGFARLWPRAEGQSVGEALGGPYVNIPFVPFPVEPQGEAIGFDQFGQDYFTLSEGKSQPLYRYARTSDDGPAIPEALIDPGSAWKYLDDGSDQGTAWREPGFDDSAWSAGEGQLGYGDGDEETIIDFGGDPNDRYITTYFRRTFDVDNAAAIDSLRLLLVFDDGAAVYLNGQEIARVNLDPNAGFDDPATDEQDDLEDAWLTIDVDPSALVNGENDLAVEVHQVAPDSDDVSFDCQVLAFPAAIAEIDGVSIITGAILEGGVAEIRASDDAFLRTRSGFGETLADLHHMEIEVVATTSVESPASLNLTIESRISEPSGSAQVRMLNHSTSQFDLVRQYALGPADSIEVIADLDSATYISAMGEIEMRIKHIVFVPFLAFTFESFFNWVEIAVRKT